MTDSDNFDGKTFDPALDRARLKTQLGQTYEFMIDGKWRTLREMEQGIKGSQAAISARLRDLRKAKFGGYVVNRRRRGNPSDGLHEYQLMKKPNAPEGGLK